MALAVFVTKSNTNGEALWFLRAGCSLVCEYHFNFFCIKYYSKEAVKVGNAMISENKTLQSVHGVHRNSWLWRSAQILFFWKSQFLIDNFSLLGFH